MNSRMILIISLIVSFNLNAQSLVKKADFSDIHIKEYVIKQFSGVQSDTTAYFKLIIHENRDHTNYTLEASIDGSKFIAIEEKEGFKSPYSQALMYCYSVNTNKYSDYKFFRIKISSKEKTNYSHTVKLYNLDLLKKDNIIAIKR